MNNLLSRYTCRSKNIYQGLNYVNLLKTNSLRSYSCKSELNKKESKRKNILITGGGTGLGRSMAEHLYKKGNNVIIVSRKQDVINKAVEEIKLSECIESVDQTIIGDVLDVRNYDDIMNLSENLKCKDIYPDVVINNAAGNFISRTEDLSMNAWNSIIDIVLKGTINMTTIFGNEMIKNNIQGSFINISTTYADTGSSFVVPSGVAKAGCNNLVRSLASEWGKYNIRFVGVAPGPIYTPGAFSRLDPSGRFTNMLEKKLPLGRFPQKKELAEFIEYLVSDNSRPINGEIINFDGGETVMNSGEFNGLHILSSDDWESIRSRV